MNSSKPIVTKRQWWRFWRHPVFPWGWQSLVEIDISPVHSLVFVCGYHRPGDGGDCTYIMDDAREYGGGDDGVWIAPKTKDKSELLPRLSDLGEMKGVPWAEHGPVDFYASNLNEAKTDDE